KDMPLPNLGVASVPESSTIAIAEGQTVTVPKLVGQTVRGVTEACSHLGLLPILVGDGIALDQNPDAGTKVLPGTKVMVHFGRAGDADAGAAGSSN
ncbi:MAG TPA: PASTA domain-containing protein, partial [Candidatus Dormibacteraeota bacterium]|nr:PASTA domain-containing protein [Candidatus Dormibacteraeota bacterium]